MKKELLGIVWVLFFSFNCRLRPVSFVTEVTFYSLCCLFWAKVAHEGFTDRARQREINDLRVRIDVLGGRPLPRVEYRETEQQE
jgi:hypothetical protein